MSFATAADALWLFLTRVEQRSGLSAEERNAVLDLPAMPRQLQAHRDIVHLDEQVDHACLVAEGLVARFAQMNDGRRQNLSLHIAGDMVGLNAMILPAAYTPLTALTAATIFQIPHAALHDLIHRHPAIGTALWRECVVEAAIARERLVSMGRRDARSRLAHMFCEMAVRSRHIGRYNAGRFAFPVTQEQIADMLGLTPVHVNRTMQALRGEELVQFSQREAVILDWPGLAFAAEFDPVYLHLGTFPIEARQAPALRMDG